MFSKYIGKSNTLVHIVAIGIELMIKMQEFII